MKKGDKIICKKYYQDPMNKRVKFIVDKQYEIFHVTETKIPTDMKIYSIRSGDYGGDVFYSDEYFEGFPKNVPTPLTPSGRMIIQEYPGKRFNEYFDYDIKRIRKLKLDKINGKRKY